MPSAPLRTISDVPSVAFGSNAYRRQNGNLPELRLVNMFVEASQAGEQGAVLLSRNVLEEHTTGLGSGGIVGGMRKDGVFGGDVFSVSATNILYRGTTALGSITGSGPVSIAMGPAEVQIARGASLHSYNGTNLATVTYPDSQQVRAVEYHDGLFVTLPADSQRYYWSAVNDGRSIDALDFASAESSPDPLLDLRVINDTLWLFGSETIEPHANTGEADAPYSRFEGRIFGKGLVATGCVGEADNTLVFTSADGMVYRIADVPERISEHGMEERISQCRRAGGDVSMFTYINQGHTFAVLRLTAGNGAGTFQFDFATRQYSELASYGRDNWRGQCAINLGDRYVFGDDETGRLLEFGTGFADIDEPLERLFTSAFAIKGGTVQVDNFNIEANVGWTELLSGQGSAPIAETRASRDAGVTWGNWRSAELGSQGHYRTRPRWRRWGSFDFPGAVFETRCVDPVPFRISSVTVNEEGGGRSR
jgi:hypothetical protein